MLEQFTPKYYFHSLDDIDLKKLKQNDIKLLFIDFDNTLVDSLREIPPESSIRFIEKCHSYEIIPVILSNNFAGRNIEFAKKYKCASYSFSLKPLKHGYKKAMSDYNVRVENCMAIGDQLLTDIWGGSRMNISTILIDPISTKDNFFGACNRIPEKFIYHLLNKKSILTKGNYYGDL